MLCIFYIPVTLMLFFLLLMKLPFLWWQFCVLIDCLKSSKTHKKFSVLDIWTGEKDNIKILMFSLLLINVITFLSNHSWLTFHGSSGMLRGKGIFLFFGVRDWSDRYSSTYNWFFFSCYLYLYLGLFIFSWSITYTHTT